MVYIDLKEIGDKLRREVLKDFEFRFSTAEYLVYTKGFLQDVYACRIKLCRDIMMRPTGWAVIEFDNPEKHKEFVEEYGQFMQMN